ncbi:MAG: transposase [Desulfotignum sp.]|nr:transposase [Desulfotignum sp.]MCF8088812.1 transposase [Desulfotignum sp.]MCF8137694.1 transposase [Desulfotignum sp.]
MMSTTNWKPYFKLDCQHDLCNAHHLRELERAWKQDKQEWARNMGELLLQINQAVDDAGGRLESEESREFRQKYRAVFVRWKGLQFSAGSAATCLHAKNITSRLVIIELNSYVFYTFK